MGDYKPTLNLPKTDFAMKANLAQREPGMLKRWQDENLYQKVREARAGREQFILHDGPPYANGAIHLGHSINRILKDIIVKSKTLSGFDAPFIPGWDCHGLPIEHNVEKKIGKAGVKVDHKTFRKKCREYAATQVKNQKADFIRLGLMADWENPYLTMNFEFEADIVRSLGKIIDNGHLVRGFKPVYWSVVGGSALAEAEVEYQDKVSNSIDVAYPAVDDGSFAKAFDSELAGNGPLSVVIWTTTPWTLPSSQAISINPELSYVVVQLDIDGVDQRIVLAEDLLESFIERVNSESHTVIAKCTGVNLEKLCVKHPFYHHELPLIMGDHVTIDAGTGCVHTAPDHGVDDFNVGKRYGIETLNYVNDGGLFRADVELFAGEHVYKVDDKVLDVLRDNGVLLCARKLEHSYPHCWRTKTPLIYRATPQWFVSMTANNLLAKVKSEVDQIEWLPDWGRARIDGMLDTSPDWCISRQRTWGVPITLFVHKDTQELHPESTRLIEEVALRIEKEGIDAWFDLDSAELLGDEAENYSKVTDTLDVWFDSGVTHEAVIQRRDELRYPADLYLEGSDQHRGWFQSSLKTAVAINGCSSYKAALTHGFTVDADGRKMSKSIGNTIAPNEIIKDFGADVLRLWVAATDYTGEITVAKENFKRTADSYRRIRNTARFILANLSGFNPEENLVPFDELVALDRWAIDCAARLQDDLIECYDGYHFHQIYQKLHNFCASDMGGFYLDIIKDRQYTAKSDGHARRSAQTALYYIAQGLTRWIAPILSFTADELWQALPGCKGDEIFVQEWFDLPKITDEHQLDNTFWQEVLQVKTAVNKVIEDMRGDGLIGKSLEAEVQLYCSDELQQTLAKIDDELRFILITSYAKLLPLADAPGDAVATELAGLKIVLSKSDYAKCDRCWHHREDVGQHEGYEDACGRCVDNINGAGEVRHFA
ncbi:MAG: isoleucyl-tRNA synthetase [Flavobacteriales bacterium]|jgi:isoleucyl-tRNA synthetase